MMAKRRATLRGRGAEILFGEPADVEIEPLSSEPTPTETESGVETSGEELVTHGLKDAAESPPLPASEPEIYLDDPELEMALEEEALAGWDGAEAEEEPLPAESEAGAGPEAAVAFSVSVQPEEALAAPEVVAEQPMAVPAIDELEEEAVTYEPPPPEVGDVIGGVLPPKPERSDLQAPDERVEPIELPDRELTEEEKAQILVWMGEQRIQQLESAIDQAYAEVGREVADNEDIATDCYNKLLKARDIVVRRDLARLAQAEYYTELVRARLRRAVKSDTSARKYQWLILLWGLFWTGAFLVLLILLNESWFREMIVPFGSSNTLVNMEVFLSTMLWGGIGGVVAVLYSLFKHVGRRDFDIHYGLSYVGKPFLGLILGATVYMVFNLVVRTLGLLPIQLESVEQIAAPPVAPGVMYLLAWVSGFKESRIFDLMDRVMKRTFSGEEDG